MTTANGSTGGWGWQDGAGFGKGQEGAAWSPADLEGLQLWFDAQDMNGNGDNNAGWTDGALVATWVDKAGVGNATQATDGDKPTFETDILNGHPVVRFDGSTWLELGNKFSIDNTVTFIAVHKCNKASTGTRLTLLGQNNTAGAMWIEYGGAGGRTTCIAGQYVATCAPTDAFPLTAETLVYRRTGEGAGTHTFRIDGVVQALTTDANHLYSGNGNKDIGRRAAGSQMLNGDIAELLIYEGALSDEEIALVEAYLNAKWT